VIKRHREPISVRRIDISLCGIHHARWSATGTGFLHRPQL